MKVLMLNGGPHKDGCTNAALNIVAEVLNSEGIETEILHVGATPTHGCMGCGGCGSTGKCVHHEDMVNDILDKLDDIDGLIVGSPVHYASAAGAISCILDRLFVAGKKKLQFKPGAAVVSCRRGGASATFDELNKYFTINNMPVVPSLYWNSVHGNKKEDVLKDEEGMQVMRQLGRNMAAMLKCFELGKKSGIEFELPEEKIKTNFIR